MIFIDTHAHLLLDDFDADRDEVVNRAASAGVRAIFEVGLDIGGNLDVLKFSSRHPGVFPIFGFHPHDARLFDGAAFADFLSEHTADAIGFGEFGLDYHYDNSPRPVQRRSLEEQLALCIPTGKPLVFHCREAEQDMLALLRAAGKEINGVMHCFSGGLDFLHEVMSLGMHISVGGPVTYPRSDVLREVVKNVPIDKLLFETDCPFLAPQQRRGKRNEPSYIPSIAEKIAEVRGMTVEETAAAVTANTLALFGGPVTEYISGLEEGDAV
ncbi:MAG TPA: TatD family hydrolase [bacterium]|nr:TatD family hydrolase [bacterium]